MAKILMRKTLGCRLEPVDERGQSVIGKLPRDSVIAIDVSRPRNIRFHRKFFAMLHLILQNQEHYKSTDDLLDVCKLRIGHVRVIQTKNGEERLPKSISFAEMSEDDFSEFYDRAVNWMLEEVIPGLRRSDLDAEVETELMSFAA